MAATNFTPISLYYTTTASATPSSGNLVAGELALNTTDEKLYFKNTAGTVKLLAANITPVANGGTALSSTPSNGQLLIGNGTNYTLAAITAGSGISVTNGSGSITIASTASVAAATPTVLGTVYGKTVISGNTTLGYNAGLVSTGTNNIALGRNALQDSTTGDTHIAIGTDALKACIAQDSNIAIGYQALSVGTTVDSNVAVGYTALRSSTTNNQVAIGYQALRSNTTGSLNTGVGHNVLRSNTTGFGNHAFGNSTMFDNTTGSANSAFGHSVLNSNGTGSYNSAFGYTALGSNSGNGNYNSAFGYQALDANSSGAGNSALGSDALGGSVTGSNNVGIGYLAGSNLTTGSNNTAIGYNSAASAGSVSNEITLGDANVTAFRIPGLSLTWNTSSGLNSLGVGTPASGTTGEIRATNNITAYYSDDRLKKRLGGIENALDKVRTLDSFYYEANETAQELGYEPIREVGISAQQVQAVLPEVVVPAPIDDKYLTVRYERLVPLLIAAIKELEEKVKLLETK
jgi:hypothetical protein